MAQVVPLVKKVGQAVDIQGIRPVVGIPMERNGVPTANIFWAFIHIAQQGWPMIRSDYQRTDLARNTLAEHCLREGFTHVVMLDGDHLHDNKTVGRLLRWAIKDRAKYQVVGGLHYRRGAPYDPQAFIREPGGKLYTYEEWPKAIMQVNIIGMASVCIAREVFEKLPRPWFKYDYPEGVTDGRYPSEDIAFCKACESAGIPIWVDTTITSPHLIEDYADEVTFRRYRQEHPGMIFGQEDEKGSEKPEEDTDAAPLLMPAEVEA